MKQLLKIKLPNKGHELKVVPENGEARGSDHRDRSILRMARSGLDSRIKDATISRYASGCDRAPVDLTDAESVLGAAQQSSVDVNFMIS